MAKKAIICVDDEDIILEALKDQLGAFLGDEFDIETAICAEEAVEIFEELTEQGIEVPVIISDYLMPGTLGDELLIKMHELNPDALKILLTGHANIEGVTNAINKANLYRFIPKPWERDDLILTVKEAIRSFLQEIEIKEKNKFLEEMNANLEKLVLERTKELSEANATKDKFFSIIAHDLKNAFNSLMGLSDILMEDFGEMQHEEQLDLISHINTVSGNSYKLLQNLLDWARMQTGNMAFAPSEVSVSELVNREVNIQKAYASQKGISLSAAIDENHVILADNNMISTVVRNLVSNATKFTNVGGWIKISSEKVDTGIQIAITDNGIGIPPVTMGKLFKVSEKCKTYGTNNEEGTGLGLILCRDFVEKNGGVIKVESEVGKGSKFSFILPMA